MRVRSMNRHQQCGECRDPDTSFRHTSFKSLLSLQHTATTQASCHAMMCHPAPKPLFLICISPCLVGNTGINRTIILVLLSIPLDNDDDPGPDCANFDVFNHNNTFLFSHELLNRYNASFTYSWPSWTNGS